MMPSDVRFLITSAAIFIADDAADRYTRLPPEHATRACRPRYVTQRARSHARMLLRLCRYARFMLRA
jgi:hypothetical protein